MNFFLNSEYLNLSDWNSQFVDGVSSQAAFMKEQALIEITLEKAAAIADRPSRKRKHQNSTAVNLLREKKTSVKEKLEQLTLEKKTILARFFKRSLDHPEYPPTLTPKGLAVLSHLYELKDREQGETRARYQPLITDSSESLYHLMEQMVDTEVDTEVTLIFTHIKLFSVPENDPFSHNHACKIIKTSQGLQFIHTDSLDDSNKVFKPILQTLLEDCPDSWPVQSISFNFVEEKTDTLYARQKTGYGCGAFASKDARSLKKLTFPQAENLKNNLDEEELFSSHVLPAPPIFLKSSQNLLLLNHYLEKNRELAFKEKLNKKGQTLQEIIQSHQTEVVKKNKKTGVLEFKWSNNYANHFTEKQIAWVFSFLVDILIKSDADQYKSEIMAIVDQFDASKITSAELESRSQHQEKFKEIESEMQPNVKHASTPHR